MVYCCRPSKNCAGCRQRRIKCDLKVPTCSQCKRAGMKCAGYRDQLSLLFRDENARTQTRSAKARERSKEPTSSPRATKNYQINIPVAPSMTIDELGLNFFFDRFTTAPKWKMDSRPPDYVPMHPFIVDLTSNETSRDVLVSVGLAALSNLTGDAKYLIAATEKYVRGIKLIRQAIDQPSRKDLQGIIKVAVVLALFEFVSHQPGSQVAWTVHAEGALAIFHQLHKGRIPTRPENMQALQSYLFYITKYFNSGGQIPGQLVEWSSPVYSSPLLNTTSRLITIMIRFVHLSANLRNPALQVSIKDTLQTALAIDDDLSSWEASLDENWSFTTRTLDHASFFYQGKCHIYKSTWAARVLNYYRWARVLVKEMIFLSISKMQTPAASTSSLVQMIQQQKQAALDTINQLAADICISVPSHSRLLDAPIDPMIGEQTVTRGNVDLPPLNGVFVLVFPLIVAGGAVGVSDELHNWVIKILGVIYSTTGIRHAFELIPVVQRMRQKKTSNFWSQSWSGLYASERHFMYLNDFT